MTNAEMLPDSWLSLERAVHRLNLAGYEIEYHSTYVRYWRQGVSGQLTIHPQGVDERAVFRIEDRGS